ncbi:TonB-dependent siderophore receptor [Psychrobacter sp. I-STPA6b]|uniref:TonB-dependent siderophore receptor n=1 Tax=Psychrobacter sp. I-STPA6b TaxID=2585718 RepID=UPI001D0C2A5C|nr:TonB-dependent siderophore receptor [Psychrobacter sp. I-STPA6b]
MSHISHMSFTSKKIRMTTSHNKKSQHLFSLATFRHTPLRHALLPLLLCSVSSAYAQTTSNANTYTVVESSQDSIAFDVTEDGSPSATFEPVVITANPLYYIDPSEDNDKYNANVATVGTKIPDYLENIPQSISVITQAKMEDLNVDTLDQMAKRTTGMRVLQNDDGRSSIYARGYEYDQFSIDGLASPMASINGTLPNLAPFDRVEVMRGPSGLFNSASEMGGVVNLVRKRGSADGKNTLKGSVTSPFSFDVTADMQGRLSLDENDDSLVTRNIFQYQQKKNPIVKEVGGSANRNATVYLSADKQLNDTSKAGVGYLFQSRQIIPNNGLPTQANNQLLPLPNDDFYGAKWNDFSSSTHDIFADFQHQLDSKGIISAGLRYSDRDADYNYVFAGSALKQGKMDVAGTAGDIKETSLSADLNFSQPFATQGGQSEYVVGADYKRFNSNITRTSARGFIKGITLQQLNDLPYIDLLEQARNKQKGYRFEYDDNTLNEIGVYGKINYKPIDSLSLIAGGRFSHYTIDNNDKAKGVKGSSKDHKVTGYGAVVYQLTPNLNAYGSYTQVFMPQYETNDAGELLKPREGDQIEIGVKGHWSDQLSARLSGYRLNDKNAYAQTSTGDKVAIGERQMQGVELEVNGEILPNWQISGGYSYLDSDIKKPALARDDGIFLLMPKHTANIWTTYQANNWLPNPLTLGLGVNVVGEFSSSRGIKADGYQTWDAMVNYPFTKNLTGQLNVYNLLDSDHYVRVGSPNTFNIPDNGREVKASLSYEF